MGKPTSVNIFLIRIRATLTIPRTLRSYAALKPHFRRVYAGSSRRPALSADFITLVQAPAQ